MKIPWAVPIIQCRYAQNWRKMVFLAQLLMNLNEFTLFVLNYKSFPSHISFFSSHFLRFHFIAKHHGIEITQIKKVEFSIKNGNQLKRSSIVINKSSTWKTQFATQNVDLCSCFFLCLKIFLFEWNRSFPCSGANC